MLSMTPLLSLLLLPFALSLDANSMRGRSVYQLVTDRFALPNTSTSTCNTSDQKYCGGTWSAITQHLDYIQGMGFDTIWISPVVENIGGTTGLGEAYHGYWTLNPLNLNAEFGTADDLKALAQALHDKKMYLQVDIVINHVAATSSSSFAPSEAYGPFAAKDDYHPFCWIQDYSNQSQVENCWLGDESVALPDLNTESQTVVDFWNGWVKDLVANYSIDSIRIDTVKHVPHSFWTGFTNTAGVFNQGEVLDGDPTYVGSYQTNGSINPFNYPAYYPLVLAFNTTTATFDELISAVAAVKGNSSDPTILGSFLNNHDNPRFESWVSDAARIKNAHAWVFATDGIPYLYYGSEAGFNGGADPANREPFWTTNYTTDSDMYKFFTTLNTARTSAFKASSSFYTDQMTVTALGGQEVLISKSPLVTVLSNRGDGQSSGDLNLPATTTNWGGKTTVIDAISCKTFTTEDSGDLSIMIENGLPRMLIEDAKKGDVCNGGETGGDTGGAARRFGVDGLAWVMGLVGVIGAVLF